MKNTSSSTDKLPLRNSKEWATIGIKGYVTLMTEFMKLSPSYDLAKRYRTEQWSEETLEQNLLALYGINQSQITEEDKQPLLDDFNRVLKTYAEFGDLTARSFDDWWEQRGLGIFGYDHEAPKPIKFGQLGRNQDTQNQLVNNLNTYLSVYRPRQGKPPTMFVAVPLGMTKRKLLKQLSQVIDKANVPVTAKTKISRHNLTAQRLRSKPLFKCLKVLMGRVMTPKTPLWRLGLRCNISDSEKITMTVKSKPNFTNVDQRIVLGVLTSRALKKAMLIAEHAARGDFPLSTNRRLPIFDWDEIYESMRKDKPQLKPRKPTHKEYKNNVV